MARYYIGNIKGPKGDQGEVGPAGPVGPEGPQGPITPLVDDFSETEAGTAAIDASLGPGILSDINKIEVRDDQYLSVYADFADDSQDMLSEISSGLHSTENLKLRVSQGEENNGTKSLQLDINEDGMILSKEDSNGALEMLGIFTADDGQRYPVYLNNESSTYTDRLLDIGRSLEVNNTVNFKLTNLLDDEIVGTSLEQNNRFIFGEISNFTIPSKVEEETKERYVVNFETDAGYKYTQTYYNGQWYPLHKLEFDDGVEYYLVELSTPTDYRVVFEDLFQSIATEKTIKFKVIANQMTGTPNNSSTKLIEMTRHGDAAALAKIDSFDHRSFTVIRTVEGWSVWYEEAKKNDTYTLTGGIEIPEGADLKSDTYLVPGNYYCPSNDRISTFISCPVTNAFVLKVELGTGVNYPKQTFYDYHGGVICSRTYTSHLNHWSSDEFFYYASNLKWGGMSTDLNNVSGDNNLAEAMFWNSNTLNSPYKEGAVTSGGGIVLSYNSTPSANGGYYGVQIGFGLNDGSLLTRTRHAEKNYWTPWKANFSFIQTYPSEGRDYKIVFEEISTQKIETTQSQWTVKVNAGTMTGTYNDTLTKYLTFIRHDSNYTIVKSVDLNGNEYIVLRDNGVWSDWKKTSAS